MILTARRLRLALILVTGVWAVSIVATPRPINPSLPARQGLGLDGTLQAEVRSVLRTSCFDCHSNETVWPWYARVFPASWLLERDVAAARGRLNFSSWMNYNVIDRADMLDDICSEIKERSMPMRPYLWLHPAASLTDRQIDAVCAWTAHEADRLMRGTP